MQGTLILRILGLLLMLFSLSMLPPIVINSLYNDGYSYPFIVSFLITFIIGLISWAPCRNAHSELKIRDGFIIVVLSCVAISLFGALPFLLGLPGVTITNAIFASVAGITTTGANILQYSDQLPHNIIFYRELLYFIGGLGIIILAVAILPMLGIGGLQLYRAEAPGPIKDAKLAPRITETAKTIWYLYLGLIALCALSYWLAGMSPFDAICESFGTISTGGLSTHSTSLAYYHSYTIDLIATLFMIIGATNFGLHYTAIRQRNLKIYWDSLEFRMFIGILTVITVIVAITLINNQTYANTSDAVIKSITNTTSLITTTGYTDGNFSIWPTFVPYLLIFISIFGGCSGSTAGGMKIIRICIIAKQAKRELAKLLHPKAIFNIKIDGHIVPEQVVQAALGFIAIYIFVYVVLLMLTLSTGVDITTAYGALTGCITNTGAGLGKVATNFYALNASSKWIMILAMLIGRLEFLTILVLFIPSFWKH